MPAIRTAPARPCLALSQSDKFPSAGIADNDQTSDFEADQAVERLRNVASGGAMDEQVRLRDLGTVPSGFGVVGREEPPPLRAGDLLDRQGDEEPRTSRGVSQVRGEESRVRDEGAPERGDAPEPAQGLDGQSPENLDQQVVGDDRRISVRLLHFVSGCVAQGFAFAFAFA